MLKSSLSALALGFVVSTTTAQYTQCPPPPTTPPVGVASPAPFAPIGSATPTPSGTPNGGVTPGLPGGSTGPGGAGSTGGAGGRPTGGVRPAGAPGPQPAGPGIGAGGATGGGKKGSGWESAVDWEWWWNFNGARYLNLKSVLRGADSESAAVGEIRGDNTDANAESKRVADKLATEIIPHLRDALDDGSPAVRAEAVLALGKCGKSFVAADILKLLSDDDMNVRENACLALGVLGDKASVAALVDVVTNNASGKKLVGRDSDVGLTARVYAAMSIGLIGSRVGLDGTNGEACLAALLETKSASNDMPIAAVTALGISKSLGAMPAIMNLVKNAEADDYVRAYAVTALGKMGERSAYPVVINALKDKNAHVRRSAAIALGQIGTSADAPVVDALIKSVKNGVDQAEKNFATMSLGRIGGATVRTFLKDVVATGTAHDKTFGSLALGLTCRDMKDQETEAIGALIHKQFQENKTCRMRGAFAIALGLMGYEAANKEIIEVVNSNAHAHLRGECAQALGLMRCREAIPSLRSLIKDCNDTAVRTSGAIALGLIGDQEAIKVLDELMKDSTGNVTVSGAALRGLGLIGNGSVVSGLGAVLNNKDERQTAVRAYAAAALGLLGDKDEIPALALLSENQNYVSQTGTLSDVLAHLY